MTTFGDIRSAVAKKDEYEILYALTRYEADDPHHCIEYVRAHLDGYCPVKLFILRHDEEHFISLPQRVFEYPGKFIIKAYASVGRHRVELFSISKSEAYRARNIELDKMREDALLSLNGFTLDTVRLGFDMKALALSGLDEEVIPTICRILKIRRIDVHQRLNRAMFEASK